MTTDSLQNSVGVPTHRSSLSETPPRSAKTHAAGRVLKLTMEVPTASSWLLMHARWLWGCCAVGAAGRGSREHGLHGCSRRSHQLERFQNSTRKSAFAEAPPRRRQIRADFRPGGPRALGARPMLASAPHSRALYGSHARRAPTRSRVWVGFGTTRVVPHSVSGAGRRDVMLEVIVARSTDYSYAW